MSENSSDQKVDAKVRRRRTGIERHQLLLRTTSLVAASTAASRLAKAMAAVN